MRIYRDDQQNLEHMQNLTNPSISNMISSSISSFICIFIVIMLVAVIKLFKK